MTPSLREICLVKFLFLLLLCLGVSISAQSQTIPANGTIAPELQAFEDAVLSYMQARNIPAGSLCLIRDGHIHINRGYGHMDAAKTIEVQPSAMFRIASVSKPITKAAIMELEAQGLLDYSDAVFDLGQPGGGILSIAPFGTPDARLKDVTVFHLLEHRGGWDRGISGDPMFKAIQISNELGVSSPPGQINTARWVMGNPLEHTPGSTYAYSNFGYLLLGLIIEEVTGQDFTAWIQENLFAKVGVPASEVELGRSLPANRNPREPWYSHPSGSAVNVFDPTGPLVPWPDGGWDLETMEAHGGLIMTTEACARFGSRWWAGGNRRGEDNTGLFWLHDGSLDGTTTFIRQRNGIVWAAFFNQRNDPSGLSYGSIRATIDQVQDGIATWPSAPDLDPPINGTPIPGTSSLDQEMTDLMKANRATAGMLAIQKNGKVIFNRSYGWKDHARTEPLFPHAMVRTGSISKAITNALIIKLEAASLLERSDKVFDVGQPGGGILDLTIHGTPDARLKDITVQHFMDHKSGLDPAFSDPTALSRQIANELSTAHPPPREDMARWVAGKALSHDPGVQYNYANVGYLILGLVIEEVTGGTYMQELQDRVFTPIGVPAAEVGYAEPFRRNMNPREPFYDSDAWMQNVYYPDNHEAEWVPGAHGGHYHEPAVGSQIMTPKTLCAYMANYTLIGHPRWPPGPWAYFFTGAYSGTNARIRQNGGGIDYVVWFNRWENPSLAGQMADVLDPIIAANSINLPDNAPPDPPMSLTASDGDQPSGVLLTWPATANASSYSIYRNTENNRDAATELISNITGTSWSDSTGVFGDVYHYWVKAHNQYGVSGFSPTDIGFSPNPPDAPENLSATDGTSSEYIRLTWSASMGATKYRIYRHTSDVFSSSQEIASEVTALTWDDTTAIPDTTYFYWVAAESDSGVGNVGNSDSGSRAVLSAPQGVQASDNSSPDHVSVSWNLLAGASSYYVFRNTTNDSQSAGQVAQNLLASPFEDTSASPGTTYYYWVRAYNGALSQWSSSDAGTRLQLPAPDAPTNVSASDGPGIAPIQVSWNAASGASSYYIYQGTSNSVGSASEVAQTATLNWTDNNSAPNQTYYYWVRSWRENGGHSAYSQSDSGSWQLAAPATVSATDGTVANQIDISWAVVPGASSYRIYRSEDSVFANSTEISNGISQQSYVDNSVAAGTIYHYWVKAEASGIQGPESSSDSGFARDILQPPGSITTTTTDRDGVHLTWGAALGATRYYIYRNVVGSSSRELLGQVSTTEFTDTTAVVAENYEYSLRSFADGEFSSFSDGSEGYLGYSITDLSIGKSAAGQVGRGIANSSGAGQVVTSRSKKVRTARLYSELNNPGNIGDTFRLAGSRGNRFFRITYLKYAPVVENISAAVHAGTAEAINLEADSSEAYRVSVSPTRSAKRSRKRTLKIGMQIFAHSAFDSDLSDLVRANAIFKNKKKRKKR